MSDSHSNDSSQLTPEELSKIREILAERDADPNTRVERRDRLPTENEMGRGILESVGRVGRYTAWALKVGKVVWALIVIPVTVAGVYDFYWPKSPEGVEMLSAVVERLETNPPTSPLQITSDHADHYFVWNPTMPDMADVELQAMPSIKLMSMEGTTIASSSNTVQLSSATIYSHSKAIPSSLG